MPRENEPYNFPFPKDLSKKWAVAKNLKSVLFRHEVEMNKKGSRVRGVKGSSKSDIRVQTLDFRLTIRGQRPKVKVTTKTGSSSPSNV